VFFRGGRLHGPKPYEFRGFGAMDVTKLYEFIGFGAMGPEDGSGMVSGCGPKGPSCLAGSRELEPYE
jgi:hypothetical protein